MSERGPTWDAKAGKLRNPNAAEVNGWQAVQDGKAEQKNAADRLAADRAQLAADIGGLGTPYRSVLTRIARGAGLID